MNLILAIVRNQNSPIIRWSIQTQMYIVGGSTSSTAGMPGCLLQDLLARGLFQHLKTSWRSSSAASTVYNKYYISWFDRPIIKIGFVFSNKPTKLWIWFRWGNGRRWKFKYGVLKWETIVGISSMIIIVFFFFMKRKGVFYPKKLIQIFLISLLIFFQLKEKCEVWLTKNILL